MEKFVYIMRLRVTGKKCCDYKLKSGVDIFQGSNSTGKTTLMWFFDFIFGSKSKDFIDPVEKNCDNVYVDLNICGKYYTIRREIESKNTIFVYDGIYDTLAELKEQVPKKYGWTESKRKGNITSFYFNNLGIKPRLVPISESRVAKFSWRNLMSLIYIPQDGWTGIQVKDVFQPLMKKSVFEIIFDINTEDSAQKEEELRDIEKKLNEYKVDQKVIREFLDKNERELGSNNRVIDLRKKISKFKELKESKLKTLFILEKTL